MDNITLKVGGKAFKNWLSYKVDADMYAAAGAFAFEAARPDIDIADGAACTLLVNGETVMTGYIDKSVREVAKDKNRLELHGRDTMGAVVDWRSIKQDDLINKDLKTIAQSLLTQIPVVSLKQLRYSSSVSSNLKDMVIPSLPSTYGRSVCEILRDIADKFGLLFFSLPDGTLCFTAPKREGAAKYSITMRKDGKGNNVTQGKLSKDLTRRYKQIKIMGERYAGAMPATEAPSKTHVDNTYPKTALPKVMGIPDDTPAAFMDARLRLVVSQQRHQGFVAEYTVPGHTNNGKLWTINQFCHVEDDTNGMHGDFLVIGRTFSLTREDGVTTQLRLSLPGA